MWKVDGVPSTHCSNPALVTLLVKADMLLEYGTVSATVTLHKSFLTIVTSTKKVVFVTLLLGLINCFNSPVRHSQGDLDGTL